MTSFTLPIPTYQCHKRVQALRIKAVLPNPRGYELHFEDERFCPVEFVTSFNVKVDAAPGTYMVLEEGKPPAYVDAAAFEAGYTLVETADGAVRSSPDWSAWPGGPSEVEAALASRDAEIERLRAAAKADEIQSCPACFTVFPTQDVDQCVECQRMSKPSAADCRKCEAATPEFSEAAARLIGPATQAAREVGK